MLDGYKTWIGLTLTVAGMLGISYLFTGVQLADLIDGVIKVAGVLLAIYGNYKSHQQIKTLKGQ